MAVSVTLQVFKGDRLIATREFNRDMIKIGRLASAHLCLEDEKVSRIHSVIECYENGTMSITDMGGVEGTFVNGRRVNKGPIQFGDEIRLGGTTIRVLTTEQAAEAMSQAPSPDEVIPGQHTMSDVSDGLAQAAEATHAAYPSPYAEEEQQAPAPQQEEAYSDGGPAEPTAQAAYSVVETGVPARALRAKKKKPSQMGLELRFLWGDQIMGSHLLRPGVLPPFTIGTAQGVHFAMGDAKLGGPKFNVVTRDANGFQLRFTDKMQGELFRKGGEPQELRAVIEGGKASHDGDAYALALEPEDFVRLDLGGVTLEVCFQPLPKVVPLDVLENIDFTVPSMVLMLFFIGAIFVISAKHQQTEGDDYADELSNPESRIAKLIIKPPEAQKNPLLEKLAKQKEKKSGQIAAKASGGEGQAGKRDAKNTGARMAPKGDPSNKDQARAMTAKIFGGKGGVSTLFGSGGLGGELKSAMGGLFGSAAGDSKGLGGLGLKGEGGGGGGQGNTIGIGAVGTKGRGGGTGDYGDGVGVLGGKKGVDIGITASDPEVMGSLDKELIRQVIARNRSGIKFCYESQLSRYPKLNGKVSVKFVINAEGGVISSNVVQTSMNNGEAEACIASRVRIMQFPKPKGGGVVVVTYPFVFKPSGE
ncbi:MAG TPA: adventurous gliding motility protein GltG [Myxococcaceae bacterium]|nr:adventurous gliding motility protein GltG [Myxococcaceae bacterium]